ncbi:hypothetical protein QQ045_032678 [Rhodiola kirilowii]
MEQEIQRRPLHELQLLPSSGCQIPSHKSLLSLDPPTSLDLQLSICLRGQTTTTTGRAPAKGKFKYTTRGRQGGGNTKADGTEQIRLAAMEKAYAERVRELARKEMELAHNELSRASHVWERAREEVGRAEMLKEQATRSVVAEGTCIEITCHCCRQRFVRPTDH